MDRERIGLIAGNGKFPLFFAQEAKKQEREIIAVAFKEETSRRLSKYVDEIHWISVGELQKLIDILVEARVTQAIMAGQVNLSLLFSKVKLDEEVKKLLNEVGNKTTEALLGSVGKRLAAENITLINSATYLGDFLPQRGVLTRVTPTAKEWADIEFGKKIAKDIAGLDIGQTVIVKDRTILAVEAIEGTDEAVRRASRFGKKEIVVVKVSKPNQDMRFDLPVIGIRTIKLLHRLKAKVLAIEEKKTLVLEKEKVIRLADRRGICIVAL